MAGVANRSGSRIIDNGVRLKCKWPGGMGLRGSAVGRAPVGTARGDDHRRATARTHSPGKRVHINMSKSRLSGTLVPVGQNSGVAGRQHSGCRFGIGSQAFLARVGVF